MINPEILQKLGLAGSIVGMAGATILAISPEAKAGFARAQAMVEFSDVTFDSTFGIDLSDFTYSLSCNANGVANQVPFTAFNDLDGGISINCIDGDFAGGNGEESTASAGDGLPGNGVNGPTAYGVDSRAATTAPPSGEDNSTAEFSSITTTFTTPDLVGCGGSCDITFTALLEPYLQVEIGDLGEDVKIAETSFDASFVINQIVNGGSVIPFFEISRNGNIAVINPPGSPSLLTSGTLPNGMNNGTICESGVADFPACFDDANSGEEAPDFILGSLDEFFAGGSTLDPSTTYQISFQADTVARTVAQREIPEPATVLGLLAVGLGLGLKRNKQQS